VDKNITLSSFKFSYQSNGTLWSWGSNNTGQLGLFFQYTYPTNPSANDYFNNVKTNSNRFFLNKVDGNLWSFGINSFGSLGLNTTTTYYSLSKLVQ
jgi:alpha-tubulin suppressor-like RCC1 family protein